MSNVKNVAALEELLSRCSGYGEYNPGSPNLQLSVISTMLGKARESLHEVKVAATGYENATNDREIAFNAMKRFCPQIIGALQAAGANKQTIADARAMVRVIAGSKSKSADRRPVPADTTGPVQPRKRGMASLPTNYEALAEYFAKLVQTVSTVAHYAPNEANLTIAGLQGTLNGLRDMNTGVIGAKAVLSQARSQRNDLLYTRDSNLCDTARAMKDYVKSVYGPSSQQYKQLVKIRFVKL